MGISSRSPATHATESDLTSPKKISKSFIYFQLLNYFLLTSIFNKTIQFVLIDELVILRFKFLLKCGLSFF